MSEVLPLADQALVQLAGEQRDAGHAALVAEAWLTRIGVWEAEL